MFLILENFVITSTNPATYCNLRNGIVRRRQPFGGWQGSQACVSLALYPYHSYYS